MKAPLAFGSALVLGAWMCVSIVACSGETPPPGFEPVGGNTGDGGAGDGGNPSANTSTGNVTSSNTATNSVTSTSTATSSVTSTGTGGLMCNQDGEPNDSESEAEDLGTQSDCNDEEQVTGVLQGVGDEDWFKYSGADEFGINCSVNPIRSVSASDPVRFCKYVQCLDEEADFECPDGTTDATSPDGRAGCCSTQGFQLDFICGSSSVNDDSAWVYMSIETQTNECVTYTISYDF